MHFRNYLLALDLLHGRMMLRCQKVKGGVVVEHRLFPERLLGLCQTFAFSIIVQMFWLVGVSICPAVVSCPVEHDRIASHLHLVRAMAWLGFVGFA